MRKPGLIGACWPSAVQEEILRAAVLPPDEGAVAWARVRRGMEIDDLWDAEVHRILPLVGANLRKLGVESPDLPRLRGLHRRTWYENHIALHRVRPALDVLRHAEVPALFLKGAPLALQHYGDLGLRPMADVDILVPWGDADRALDALSHAGWSDVGGRSRADLFRRYHGSGLSNPDGGQLDVHWHLGTPLLLPNDEAASSDDFWRAAVPFVVPDHGIDAVTLCPTDMLLHVIAHGLWAGSASTVRWVADAHVVIGTGEAMDWRRLSDQAIRRRIAPLVADALRYLESEFSAPVPVEVIDELHRSPSTRRERRLLRALAGPVDGPVVFGGLPHLRAYWAYTRLKWEPRRAARELPSFIADLWGLDRPAHVPAAAVRRMVHRLRRQPDPALPQPTEHAPRSEVSVIVPTHHRAEHLERCLDALDAQVVPPLEVIVVRGVTDTGAAAVIARRVRSVTEVVVPTSTLVDRLHAGASLADAPIIAFTDDDAAPHADWVDRLQEHFTDLSIGAVGGRDLQPGAPRASARRVGRIGLGGRVIGGHSDGVGPARDVEHLRGVNMAFRRHLLRLPVGLRGPGAPGYNELAPCLAVLDAGRRVVYDPALLVDHDLAPRYEHGDGNRIHAATAKRVEDAFNQSYTLLSLRPKHRWRRLAYVTLLGDRSTGGLLRCGWAAVRGDQRLAGELRPLLGAHWDAWRESQRQPLRTVSPDETFPARYSRASP